MSQKKGTGDWRQIARDLFSSPRLHQNDSGILRINDRPELFGKREFLFTIVLFLVSTCPVFLHPKIYEKHEIGVTTISVLPPCLFLGQGYKTRTYLGEGGQFSDTGAH